MYNVDTQPHKKRIRILEIVSIRRTTDIKSLGWGPTGGANAWTLSGFAYEFMEFIENTLETVDKTND